MIPEVNSALIGQILWTLSC